MKTTEKEIKAAAAELAKEAEVRKVQKIEFNYEVIEPEKPVTTLHQLKEIVSQHFPDSWFELEGCLSTYATLALKNLNGCPTLILTGNPSDEKTTDESFFYGFDLSYLSDDFTPKSFVSHAANVSEENRSKVDLLPKLKNKVLITPELAPLFEAPKDKLVESISILTRVLDGEGLSRDSGVHGHRGYTGQYQFVWLGATTPLRYNFWNVAGKIGNRLFFLMMSPKNRKQSDYMKIFTGTAYEEKVKICRGAVHSFLKNFFKKHPARNLSWDNKQDVFVLEKIIKYARLLSKFRGSLITWKSREERGEYEHTHPIIEEPTRAISSLINFARGHALINGRTHLHSDDLELVRRICLSSMPYDRFKFLELLLKHEGRLTTEIIQKELNCSDETARKTMKTFQVLGVVDLKSLPIGEGRPMLFIELKSEFMELINQRLVSNDLEKGNPSEKTPVYVNGVTHNTETQNNTQGINGLENPNPSEKDLSIG